MYQLKDRVVKIAARTGTGDRFISVGARGEVTKLTPPTDENRDDYPYIQVRFQSDMASGINGGTEWLYESELVRADAYSQFEKENGRAPTQADVQGSADGVQLLELFPMPPQVGQILGDGPVPHFDLPSQREDMVAAEISSLQLDAEPMVLGDSQYRKMLPVGTVTIEYFPLGDRARAAVAWVGNEKHRPGLPLGWSRGISDDHENALLRHLQDMKAPGADGWDTVELPDGRVYQYRHAAAASWRASAIAQLDAESVGGQVIRRLK